MTEKKSQKSPKKGSEKAPKKAKDVKDIGIKVTPPKDKCENDAHCPFHGNQNVRGRTFKAKVIRSKVPRSVQVEWTWKRHVPKYERYEKMRTRLIVHNPSCIDAQVGDDVLIMETRI